VHARIANRPAEARVPVDPAGAALAWLVRSVVQLDDDVDAEPANRGHDGVAHCAQRGVRRPGRRIQHCRQTGIEPEVLENRAAIERSVDEAVDFRIAGQLRLFGIGIDEAGLRIAFETIAVWKTETIERGDRGAMLVGASSPYLPATP